MWLGGAWWDLLLLRGPIDGVGLGDVLGAEVGIFLPPADSFNASSNALEILASDAE